MSSSQSSETGRTGADEDLGDLFEEAPMAYVHLLMKLHSVDFSSSNQTSSATYSRSTSSCAGREA
jgi:hypothetical protein